jgi:RNA polymerase sigma-70 factor (ECF subfamily)
LAEREQIAWLRRVAQRKVADYYRSADRRSSVNIDDVVDVVQDHDSHDSPEDAALRGEEYLALRSVVEELSPEQQSILRMRFSEGLRCAQIAARLGKQEGTVRKILSRTLNQLRTLYMKSLREVR